MFVPDKSRDGAVIPFEYLPCSAIKPTLGMALTFSSGKLAKCTGANTPEYISMVEKEDTVTAGDIIPVVRVDHDTVYATTLSAAGTSLALGQKVTVATDALRVTATTTDGVAEIVGMEGTATGSTVYVRF